MCGIFHIWTLVVLPIYLLFVVHSIHSFALLGNVQKLVSSERSPVSSLSYSSFVSPYTAVRINLNAIHAIQVGAD
jgi:hypothetical protein